MTEYPLFLIGTQVIINKSSRFKEQAWDFENDQSFVGRIVSYEGFDYEEALERTRSVHFERNFIYQIEWAHGNRNSYRPIDILLAPDQYTKNEDLLFLLKKEAV